MMDLPVAKRIRVGRGEMTCTRCGETTAIGYCVRCNEEAHGGGNKAQLAAKLVPTTSYLREGEYEIR